MLRALVVRAFVGALSREEGTGPSMTERRGRQQRGSVGGEAGREKGMCHAASKARPVRASSHQQAPVSGFGIRARPMLYIEPPPARAGGRAAAGRLGARGCYAAGRWEEETKRLETWHGG